MDKWTHPLEPPTIKWLPTAVTLAIILLVLRLEHVRLMECGAPLHLSVNVSTTFTDFLSIVHPSCNMLPTVIPLSIRGRILTNNVMLAITDIGEGASALTCHTELTTCCREQDNPSGGALGEWTGPDSNQIPESNSTLGFYVSRQRSSISLNRGGNSTVGGQYCCVIPRTGEEMTFCVNVQVGELILLVCST